MYSITAQDNERKKPSFLQVDLAAAAFLAIIQRQGPGTTNFTRNELIKLTAGSSHRNHFRLFPNGADSVLLYSEKVIHSLFLNHRSSDRLLSGNYSSTVYDLYFSKLLDLLQEKPHCLRLTLLRSSLDFWFYCFLAMQSVLTERWVFPRNSDKIEAYRAFVLFSIYKLTEWSRSNFAEEKKREAVRYMSLALFHAGNISLY